MSWHEKIKVAFRITTGDGVTYNPLLSQANTMSVDMMASSFEFSGIDGSLVKRKSTSGRNFPLVFFFTGSDHLDTSDNFIESAKNKKPWTIEHPKYGSLYVQPITIKREDSNLNSTAFSVEVRETIKQNYPSSTTSKKDTIRTLANNTTLSASDIFGIAVKEVSTEDKLQYTSSLSGIYEQYKQSIKTSDDSTALENLYQKSLAAVDILHLSTIQDFILSPVGSASGIVSRLSQFSNAYNQITDLSTFSLKEYFQALGASIIAGMCLSSITPNDGDYSKRKDVVSVASTIQDIYESYIETLDDIQDENLSLEDAFNADPEIVSSVDRLVKETLANLNEVVFGALVENTYVVPAPTNLILLSHLLLGQASTENVDELISVNDFTRDELVQIKKDRNIVYYA